MALMLRFILNLLLALPVFGVIAVAAVAWHIVPGLPDVEALRDTKMQVPLRIYSAESTLIAEFGEKRRAPVGIAAVPEQMIQAFLAAEDDRFYAHPGVDWQGLLRAAYELARTGTKKQGGSTITMQVARNFFLSREKTYVRKLNEIFLALKIERELDKNEILELYLNKIYLGQRAYGVGAAARVYYGKDIGELTLAETAMIAGLPKAPSATNPITNPERARARRDYVLERMRALSFISDAAWRAARAAPVSASLHRAAIGLEAPYIAEMIRSDLVAEYGEAAYTRGLIVSATISDKNQLAANQALRAALSAYDRRHGYRGPEDQIAYHDDMTREALERALSGFPVLGNLYPAIVTGVSERAMDAWLAGIGPVTVGWEGLQWARRHISENRREAAPDKAREIVAPGDVIRLLETETGDWVLSQLPEVEGALVSLSPDDGRILALAGGFDFYRNKFNRATQARRQPGSGFKPFIYSAAIAAGNTAATIINDAPVVFADSGMGAEWRPENYSRKHFGPTRLREALIHSRNLVSVRLLDAIGVGPALAHIQKFGFEAGALPANLSLSLGSAELSPWEMARAYGVFANGGYLIDPYYIAGIKTYDGAPVYTATPARACPECETAAPADPEAVSTAAAETETLPAAPGQPVAMPDGAEAGAAEAGAANPEALPETSAPRVVSAENIWIMNSMLRDVIRFGTGRRALQLGRRDLAGKTGTTNDQHDAWFSGFNAGLVTVAWVGFDRFKPLGNRETGGRAALPMWIDYMKVALEGMPESILPRPESLINVRIDPASGQLAGADNPGAIFEVFRPEHAPGAGAGEQPGALAPKPGAGLIPEQLF